MSDCTTWYHSFLKNDESKGSCRNTKKQGNHKHMVPKEKAREKAKEKRKESQKPKPTQKEIAEHGLAMAHAREGVPVHMIIHGRNKDDNHPDRQEKERVRMEKVKEKENQNPKAPEKENTAEKEMIDDPYQHQPEENHHLDKWTNQHAEIGSKAHVQKVLPVITGTCKCVIIMKQVLAISRRENANSFTAQQLKLSQQKKQKKLELSRNQDNLRQKRKEKQLWP
jgi:hypothetical protein